MLPSWGTYNIGTTTRPRIRWITSRVSFIVRFFGARKSPPKSEWDVFAVVKVPLNGDVAHLGGCEKPLWGSQEPDRGNLLPSHIRPYGNLVNLQAPLPADPHIAKMMGLIHHSTPHHEAAHPRLNIPIHSGAKETAKPPIWKNHPAPPPQDR